MQFVQKGNTLTALITNPHKIEPECLNISPLLILPPKDLNRVLNATCQLAVGKKCSTQHHYIKEVLRPFGHYLHWDTTLHQGSICQLPDTFEGWQRLVLQFGLWYISRPGTKASLETLCKDIQGRVLPWLEFLQEDGLIPLGVVLPNMKLPKEQGNHGTPLNPILLGEKPTKPTQDNEPIEKVREPLENTLAGPIFWHSDAEYLDQVEATLRNRDQALADVLDDFWLRLVRDYRSGQQMLQQVTVDDWRLREQNSNWIDEINVTIDDKIGRNYPKKISKLLISPRHPKGYLWGLRMMMQQLEYSNDPECLTPKALRQHPACLTRFLKTLNSTPIAPLLNASSLSPQQAELLSFEQLFCRFLGLLNITDIAVAIALLIREHANLTPEALSGAQLLNARGKSYMLLTDDVQPQIFSVDKPRAGCRKYAALTPRAARVMRHLLRATKPVRALLKRAGHPHWRYLLLGVTQIRKNVNGLGHPPRNYPARLHDTTGNNKFTLARCYPALTIAGLGTGTLDFNKIRHTQGVAWFDKGSVRAVQKRLGNSHRVAIEHYIPDPLIQIWNERIIRRFQNTLLVLAAAEEDYLPEVVDMPNLAELHRFLAQLVYELPIGRSPIADKLHQLYAGRYRIDHAGQTATKEAATKPDDLLHLRLSPNSLALLLAYRQWAQQHLTATIQNKPDHLTGLTPKHFIDLGRMLQAAAQNEDIGYALRESLNVKKLQRVYDQAESKVSVLLNHLTHLSLQPTDTKDTP